MMVFASWWGVLGWNMGFVFRAAWVCVVGVVISCALQVCDCGFLLLCTFELT